jgi:hypothetical protein
MTIKVLWDTLSISASGSGQRNEKKLFKVMMTAFVRAIVDNKLTYIFFHFSPLGSTIKVQKEKPKWTVTIEQPTLEDMTIKDRKMAKKLSLTYAYTGNYTGKEIVCFDVPINRAPKEYTKLMKELKELVLEKYRARKDQSGYMK